MLYEIAKPLVMAVARVLWNPTISGVENIPDDGPVIIASNHLAYCDSVFLPGQVRRSMHILGKSDFFSGRSPANKVIAQVMRGLHVMPVDRTGGSASRSAIDAGLHVLRAGKVLGIYPEGTRSPDGRLYRGKTGVARFALATGTPIVPVAMLGAHEAQRGRKYFPRRTPRIHVVLGEPLDGRAIARTLESAEEAAVLRGVTDAVMDRIQELSGQERSDEYAADVKRRMRAQAQSPAGDSEPDARR
ncbi:1-acyl-sn-glycerol-3-phosphate acyltransferase [Brachybacterium sp. FME24]|uniref:lysophospholipid acyltransferase family protein n=1 Tax=Brachybacterium sp. FME24 TaxID=2742605 RepID=UPI001866B239|nr:lysophospholipid acyltransferase family protein [Brachybacterium sp. FME24]